jgi:hypothetical protein
MDQENSEENHQLVTEMTGIIDLFKNGWHFAFQNVNLIGLIAIPFCVIEVFNYLGVLTTGSTSEFFMIIEGFGSLVALVFYILFFSAALFLITHPADDMHFSQGFAWAKQNFWSLVWIGILSAVVFMGGFLLLIIPGIIVAVYISLSQMVLVNEGKTGLAALVRSHNLVKGNWWPAFIRLCGVQLLFFVSIVIAGISIGLLTAAVGDESLSEFILNIVFTIFGAVGVLIMLSATKEIYAFLLLQSPDASADDRSARVWYIALACIGLLIPVIIGLSFGRTMDTLVSVQSAQQVSLVQMELSLVQEKAVEYYKNQDESSYVGVCAEVENLVSADENIVCNESENSYAVSVQLESTTLCADSTGYNKIVYTELEEGTQCLHVD